MLKLLTIFSFTFLVSFASAQKTDTFKVPGQVISGNSGEPISEGVIMVSKTKGFPCDSSGRFILYNVEPGQLKLSFNAFGYDRKDTIISIPDTGINNIRWVIYTDCWMYNKEKALKDIDARKPLILLQGGIAPTVFKTDNEFENKYKVTFLEFGCVAPDRQECLTAYNRTVFEYLSATYGNKWKKEIRKDAIGLKKR